MKIGEANRTQSSSLYSANRSGGPNTKKKLLAHCAWSALPIGAPIPPAPILMADRTQKKYKNVRILNRQGGEIIRCANNMFTKTTV
jgi:hypothetical protein